MKHLLLILILLLGIPGAAQDREAHREQIKALKTAYITEELALTAEEAQIFWPIYNAYHDKRRKLYRKEHQEIENLECMSEGDASEKLTEYVALEKEDYLLKQQYYEDLRKVFSAKRIMLLNKVEDDFNDKLMKEYRSRKNSGN